MKISHEIPISFLKASREFNDYEYCLAHLCFIYPEYKQFYYDTRHIYNREVLLDCSTFELKKSFDPVKYKELVEYLQPNCYIIPDVLEDSQETIRQCNEWLSCEGKTGYASEARKIGVVQGKSFQELVDCYKFMVEHVDQIAISFDYSAYEIWGLGRTKLDKFCTGRQMFINMLISEGIWNWRMPVHLLGASRASEFSYYQKKRIYNLVSADTSNPVMCGIKGIKYDVEFGSKTKPTEKLADNILIELTDEQKDLIYYNVAQFRKIIEG